MTSSVLRIHGVVPPVPTPLDSNGRVDGPALARILEHLIAGGCHGVFLLGSSGELPSLDAAARETVIRTGVATVAGRIPVLVGVTDTCEAASIALAARARDLGADAVVLAAPYYYELSSRELQRHISRLLGTIQMPAMLYNMPWLTGHVLDEDCLRVALEFPHMLGFKDSSGDLGYLQMMVRVAAERSDVTVLVGNDSLFLPALEMGAHGVVGGGANFHPRLFCALAEAHAAGDAEAARGFQQEIDRVAGQLYQITGHPCSVFAAVKGALAAIGLCRSDMAPPLTACTPAQIDEIRGVVRDLEVAAG